MRPLALVVLVVCAFGCDNEPGGPFYTSRVDRKVVAFASQGPCFEGPLFDEDPAAAGLQPACTGSYVLADGIEEILPMCGEGTDLCWRLVEDTVNCPASSYAISIETSGLAFGVDATATVECLLAD